MTESILVKLEGFLINGIERVIVTEIVTVFGFSFRSILRIAAAFGRLVKLTQLIKDFIDNGFL